MLQYANPQTAPSVMKSAEKTICRSLHSNVVRKKDIIFGNIYSSKSPRNNYYTLYFLKVCYSVKGPEGAGICLFLTGEIAILKVTGTRIWPRMHLCQYK